MHSLIWQRGLQAVRAWALDTGLAAAGRGGDPGWKALLLFEYGEYLWGERGCRPMP
jgi:hypothetical protein